MTQPLSFESNTPRLSLPYLFVGQTQKELFINAALSKIDSALQTVVMDIASSPPVNPQAGEAWIVDNAATGEWFERDDHIAFWTGDQWQFIQPFAGMHVHSIASDQRYFFRQSWEKAAVPANPNGGTVIDLEARSAIINLVETLRIAGILPAQ